MERQSNTDQSRADPAATAEEMLKATSKERTSCSVRQMLIINSSWGSGENKTWGSYLFKGTAKKKEFLLFHLCRF